MIYAGTAEGKEQAQLECDLTMRKSPGGGLWVPKLIVHVFGERHGNPYEDEAWQPQRVDTGDQHVRRTMYHA